MEKQVKRIKDSMRIKHNALDFDIENNIVTAVADLTRVGVNPFSNAKKKSIKEDALILKAIELYCKAQADYMGKGIQFESSYEKLRDALSLCGDYNE